MKISNGSSLSDDWVRWLRIFSISKGSEETKIQLSDVSRNFAEVEYNGLMIAEQNDLHGIWFYAEIKVSINSLRVLDDCFKVT